MRNRRLCWLSLPSKSIPVLISEFIGEMKGGVDCEDDLAAGCATAVLGSHGIIANYFSNN
ncbi:hypothetical protein [Pseudoduganella lutea]|uniref:Uncharacterized protein n=1 Tax=Pseudoduganella lutea TaxID=321985 RepID=A0A4P6L3P5_9BURK|nr:hypothetical protein [Pseudoduganella lutea]QBE65905.1 hypothetical protein EWM63_25380 [Pseudoduganella lutea]